MKLIRTAWLVAFFCTLAPAWAAPAEPMTFLVDDFPPFTVNDNGAATGPFPEIVLRACAALKIACELKFHPWRRAQWLAESGQVDGLFVMLRTPAREPHYYFSRPLVQTSYSVFARKGGLLKYSRPDDLRGYTIGVYGPAGTSAVAAQIAEKVAPPMELVLEMDNPTALRKLRAGRYGALGAVVINSDLGRWIVEREHIEGLQNIGEIQKVDYQVGLSRKKLGKEQAERFLACLHVLLDNGVAREIIQRHGLRPAF